MENIKPYYCSAFPDMWHTIPEDIERNAAMIKKPSSFNIGVFFTVNDAILSCIPPPLM